MFATFIVSPEPKIKIDNQYMVGGNVKKLKKYLDSC